ncbi:MAG TPA: aldo/keto reductase [Chitinophagaceae bacterium]|jgi:aryl-alcohol dehydrogenase-like predicted oxidoreductase|nr:aldo/keto reductase [Chitinophagaceae bacterium]
MEYRKIGETNLKCSVITFGAWAIGGWKWGGSDRNEAVKAIRAAYEMGVTSIDTAPAYGQGLSEEIIAEALQGIPRDKVQILTKYGLRWDVKEGEFYFKTMSNDGKEFDMYKLSSKKSIFLECENSLRRLKTDYIDLYQAHWRDSTTPVSETMEAMIKLKEQGKIREAGVCNYSVALMQEAEKTFKLASDQVPYSMILRQIEKDLVPYCIENKKSIIAYSPLQRGLLTGKIKPGHVFSGDDHRRELNYFSDENIARVNRMLNSLRPLAENKGATLPQLVLRWTIDQPGITLALAGARNADQAIDNAKAANIKLSPEEIAFINTQLQTLQLAPA